jgi:tetratricopeptide (TPR) repeat protein
MVVRLTLAAVFALVLAGSPARADEIDDFEAARRSYEAQTYGDAARRLEAMIGGEVPAIESEILVLEARKYLAATYLFLGRRDAASEQFRLLLRQDPTYQLDPLGFPAAVLEVFSEVRTELDAARARDEEERRQRLEQLRRERLETLLQREARLTRLLELARTETVETRASRAVATLPFGIGQFQNGHATWGRAFAATELTLVIFSAATWGWHRWLRGQVDEVPPNEADRFRRQERAARITNQLSMSLLGAVMLAGILDAHLRFVPLRTRTRERELPPDLELTPEPPEPSLEVGLGPGGASLRLRF